MFNKIKHWIINLIYVFGVICLIYISFVTVVPSNIIFNVSMRPTSDVENMFILEYDTFKTRRCQLQIIDEENNIRVQRIIKNVDTNIIYNISDALTTSSNLPNRFGFSGLGYSKDNSIGILIPTHIPAGKYYYNSVLHYKCNPFDYSVVNGGSNTLFTIK